MKCHQPLDRGQALPEEGLPLPIFLSLEQCTSIERIRVVSIQAVGRGRQEMTAGDEVHLSQPPASPNPNEVFISLYGWADHKSQPLPDIDSCVSSEVHLDAADSFPLTNSSPAQGCLPSSIFQ